MKEALKTIKQLKPGDLVLWRIPHMRETHGVGLVLNVRNSNVSDILVKNVWETIFSVRIKWQKAYPMTYVIYNVENPKDPGVSMWRLV